MIFETSDFASRCGGRGFHFSEGFLHCVSGLLLALWQGAHLVLSKLPRDSFFFPFFFFFFSFFRFFFLFSFFLSLFGSQIAVSRQAADQMRTLVQNG